MAWQHLQDSYIRRRGIRTITNTGTVWTLKTITVLWTTFFALWTERNSEVHGHDQASQQVARFGRLRLEMEHLHQSRDQVLAVDTDLFIGNNTADLTHYLSIARASNVQNWLNIWKPVILDSVKKAKTRSIQGVSKLQSYFQQTREPAIRTTEERLRTSQHHSTAWRPTRRLPDMFRYKSILSFFGPRAPTHTAPFHPAQQPGALRAPNSGFATVRDDTRHCIQPDSSSTTIAEPPGSIVRRS